MATHSYIIERENEIIRACEHLKETREALALELSANGGKHPTLSRDNRDLWGTLHINALQLRRELSKLLATLSPHFPHDAKSAADST